jgi:hypothetical protein
VGGRKLLREDYQRRNGQFSGWRQLEMKKQNGGLKKPECLVESTNRIVTNRYEAGMSFRISVA